ncbi:NDMA-dependent alcohol dehydrogenase [Pseudonocardia ailaonensis]|uniref:NDMA-dependent alcohol dehydrogenase n=1 Tax=Pseudonocardia ailaonensis TaxID=367279 RepID=A0ABN2N594_9PSEU
MKSRGALLWKPGTMSGWSVEDIEVGSPKSGEAMVKLAASGICHSDDHLDTGDLPLYFEGPIMGGHEGAGVVVEVGEGVTDLEVGDHIILSFLPSCGRCAYCVTGRTSLCVLSAGCMSGMAPDGTKRVFAGDVGVGCNSYLGTFSQYVTVPTASIVKVDKDLPLDKACLIGCGVSTGWGSAVYAADTKPGDTVVVVGTGGVGMSAVQGARMAGARHIIALDTVEFKRQEAPKFGATHVAGSFEEAQRILDNLRPGDVGADRVIVTCSVGYGSLLNPSLDLTRKGGTCVFTNMAPLEQRDVELDLFSLSMMGKRLQGTLYGNTNARVDIPRLANAYMDGVLKLDEMITRTYGLDEINTAFKDMREGRNLRGVIMYDG